MFGLSDHALGAWMSVATALVWSAAVLLLRQGVSLGANATNLFKNTIGTALMIPTLAVVGFDDLLAISAQDAAVLAISGVLGIAIGDTLFLAALHRLGASWMALFDCVYAPTVVLAAVVVLHEPLGAGFAAGALLVVAGLLLATWQAPRDQPISGGLWLGFGSIVVVAAAVVMAKPALGRSGLIAATALRLGAGLAAQVVVLSLSRRGRAAFSVFWQPIAWRKLLPAAVLGTWLAMILWLGGTKYTHASVAALLNQTAVVFMLLGAHFFLGEQVSARRWVGSGLAAAGAAIVALG